MRLVHVPQRGVSGGRGACIRVQASKGKTVRFIKPTSTDNTATTRLQRSSSGNVLAEPLQTPAAPAPPTPASEQPGLSIAAWESLPARYKMLVTVSMAFIVCNMDKVNISVAIIPMAQEYGWNASTAGLIQSSFFFGYMLSQIPGGWLSSKIGGRWVFPAGVGLWSAATAGVPLLASTLPGLFTSRAAVGLGEGVAPAAATDIVARTIDKSERARATSFIFGGLHIGSLIGLLAAPPLIEAFGWQSVFYLFGGAGLLWVWAWEQQLPALAAQDPALVRSLTQPIVDPSAPTTEAAVEEAIPWRAILRQRPFWALAFTHFCNNWFHHTMMAWLPTYFTDTLNLDLTHAAQLSLLPPIAALVVASIAGTSADALYAKGVPLPYIRKGAQCLAFLGPTACLATAMVVPSGPLSVALITGALGMASFSLAGLFCNHADLSTRYAPFMLGCTTTVGAVPGIIGVAATGFILDRTDSWSLALFAPSILFFLAGSVVFTMYGRTDPVELHDNSPLPLERTMRAWLGQKGH